MLNIAQWCTFNLAILIKSPNCQIKGAIYLVKPFKLLLPVSEIINMHKFPLIYVTYSTIWVCKY